ncbi:hypothetical protein CVT26_013496 [Gymnopilus dilepis]|uniref:Uncharacterized protein n=1 Tax=Gymnopilus dilepis TaxID=231916 RepID=A0A409Y5R6_9AGAR|nr:hypothetical protein CVT26_013496 [Gymnopilus dilepis]
MVNPGAFKGARKAFLMGEKETYSRAVDDGYVAEAVAQIQRRFFKRFPLDLPDDVDPTEETLAAVDDDEIEPEREAPDPDTMTKEEYEAAIMVVESRQKKIAFRRNQIKRWLAYQYTKDHDAGTKLNGPHNPYRALLFKLTGQQFDRPRAKTPCNLWRKTQREAIESQVKTLSAESPVPKTGLAALRDRVARDMFDELPEEEKQKWKFRAQQESADALKTWEKELKSPPSTAPEDRQRCILGLVRFVQPVLDLVCEATGWKASFIAGGPEPAHDGKLNIISVHSGKTTGDVPLDFGTLERDGYKKNFLPMYGRFLKKCYSVEECHARALKVEDVSPLQAAEVEKDGATYFSVEDPPPVVKKSQALDELRRTPLRPPKAPKTGIPPLPVLKPKAPKTTSPPHSVPVLGSKNAASHSHSVKAPGDHSVHNADRLPPRLAFKTRPLTASLSNPSAPKRSSPLAGPPSFPLKPPSGTPDTRPTLSGAPPPTVIDDPFRLASPPAPTTTQTTQAPIMSDPPTPPELDQTLLPSHPPSPPQSPPLSPPYSPPHSPPQPSLQSLPQPPSPSRPPSPTGSSSPIIDSVAPISVAPGDTSYSDSVRQPTTADGNPLPPSPVSQALRRSKRRRSIGQESTEPRPTKKGRVTGKSQVADGNIPVAGSATNQPASLTPLSTDGNAPEWFESAVEMLQSRALDNDKGWMGLVKKWTQFEAQEGYVGSTRLSATSRPEVISAWLHRKRSPNFQPSIDLRRYPKTYMDWWLSLQPGWRVTGRKISFNEVQGDWESLRKPGINGFVNIMVSLFFWGCAVKENRRSSKDWDVYVADCHNALTQLLGPCA